MSHEPPAALPSWAEPYLDEFAGILRVVELSGGFVLLPVEVPGPDLARALAEWLESKGHVALVFAPQDDEEWRYLSTRLLEAKPEEGGVCVVIAGGDLSTKGVSLAFRLVNERRDAISKRIGCPLLWCGTAEFLLETAQWAPDFWSVRAVERRLRLREREEKPREEAAAPSSRADLLEEARRQGDRKSISTLTVGQIRPMLSAGELAEAEALLAGTPAAMAEKDPEDWGEIELLRAEVARRRGQLDQSEAMLQQILAAPGLPKLIACRAHLLLGRVRDTGDDADSQAAAVQYQTAKELAQAIRAPALERLASYRHVWRSPRHVLELWGASRTTSVDDRPVQALLMAIVAAAMASSHDIQQARRLLAEASALAERSKDDPTILFGGEVEEELQKAREVITRLEAKPEPKKVAITPTPAVPQVEATTTSKSGRGWWIAAVALALVLVGSWALWRYYDAVDEVQFCFTDGALIHCTRSLGACEELRAKIGPSAGPCQPVTTTFP
ncbi:hypothetical protein [Polyangium spumosum]|uniref:Uncharacterized protein n=1 Tax=Polyangium spumosum TaxID=889282 RepID=A0A6N7PU11_9BACT|nr:hypothetical protein [Polyangium spumosum]MRG95057.1 hypothetical protein [Polyangium spumosum]